MRILSQEPHGALGWEVADVAVQDAFDDRIEEFVDTPNKEMGKRRSYAHNLDDWMALCISHPTHHTCQGMGDADMVTMV